MFWTSSARSDRSQISWRELGKLLLMFLQGLEINLELFRRARNRSIALGVATTVVPLVLGTIVGLAFGYAAIPAIVIGVAVGFAYSARAKHREPPRAWAAWSR